MGSRLCFYLYCLLTNLNLIMKILTKKFFNSYLLLVLTILFSCGKDEAGPQVGSITIETSSDVVKIGEALTITAVSENAEDITDLVEFFVNNSSLDGNTYTPSEAGDLQIHATYGGVTSNTLSVSSIKEITSITITSDKSAIKPTGSDIAVITATDQDGTEVSTLVDFYVNGTLNPDGNKVSATALGDLEISAEFESLESNKLVVSSEVNVTSLTVEASRTTIPADSYTAVEISVLDQDEDDITSVINLYIDDVLKDEPLFVSGSAGTFQLKATYESVESSVVEITVNPFVERKVLIEEFTGEWCGWCPQAAYNLDELVKEHPYVLTVGIHNGDGLAYENEATIRSAFGIDYFPSGLVGRVNLGSGVGYNGPTLNPSVIGEVERQIYDSEVLAGVDISSTFTASEASVDVDVKFYADISDEVKITIYIIENDVVSGIQQNYFSGLAGYEGAYYYSQPATLSGYQHQYVLRRAATDVQGESIPQGSVVKDGTYSLNDQTIDISGYDPEKCYIIAFAHYALDGKKTIINAQQVKLGESSNSRN